ncbi:hypothetical protein CI109_103928 [Kwoniella shandongensis]|uniref:Fe2OG dioxygenase domain-containing protein n=1 Tax=Kwoniella shandongensis TaxID=1734106 RepID=A0A5M6BVM3_9TREE|nr:uncharacterized protein CI109_005618 [Kwoniella shandongensis]KAA5526022.1 hypothetical protein CI109_005618 [Kwoniella shandongensis]
MKPTPTLPIIDPTPYLPTTTTPNTAHAGDRARTAKALHEACRDVGFFYLRVDNYLTKEELDEVLVLAREFFGRSKEEKEQIGLDETDRVRGYQRLHQNVTQGKADHHEGLDLYAPNPYPPREQPTTNGDGNEGRPLRPLEGPNLWPSKPEQFKPKMEQWIEKMKVLGMAVMRGMADGLGMSEVEGEGLRACVDESFWVMRVIGYPPLPQGADGISCGEHTDYGCLTLLHSDPTIPDSLQVLSTSGRWMTAFPVEGCIVVNIGSMWEYWTGGLYRATLHRVIHKSPKYRVSIPFFFEPNFDARVKLLDAARRKADEEGKGGEVKDLGEKVYGDYLLEKVGGNFKY